MSHDWSARRSRETMNSALPQPSSNLKRTSMAAGNSFASHQHGRSLSGSRHSLAMRPDPPPFAPRPSMGPPGSGNSGFSSAPRRQSLFPQKQGSTPMGPPPSSISMTPKAVSSVDAERRTSVYRTRAPQQSFFQAVPNITGHPRDPRPLRDRNYQAQLGQELIDYMVQYNFEQEMKHSMSPNMMKSPTQKDFNLMFQWLYKRIDPSHRFQKNIDQEVPPILKQLRYPYEKNITKSQIAAVGGQNWSTFLGLLHWMMSLARMIEGYTTHGYEEACLAAGIDLRGDRIVNNFLKAAYQEWIELPDDIPDEEASLVLDKHIEVMAEQFKRNDSQYIQELEHLEAEYAQLQQQIDDIEKDTPDPATLDKNCAIMEDDANKFRTYNSLAQGRVEKYETRIASLQAELQNVAVELQEAEEERRGLQQIVDDQGISMQDIDRMTAERERLQKGIEALGSQLDEAKKVVAERETEAARRLDELERMIREYNTMAYQIGLIPSTAANANGQNYELQIAVRDPDFTSTDMLMKGTASSASDRLLANGSTGYQPAHVLNLDLRGKIKDSFIKLQRHVAERRAESVDDMMKDHEVLDGMKEAMEEKQNEIDALEHRIRALDQEYERTKDITSAQKMSSDLQIEKLENELAKMRAGLSESVQLMEQREMNTNIEYEQLVVRANALREELHTEIDRMLNDVIKFKLHVQKNLDDYEGFVADEVEEELGSLKLEFEEDPRSRVQDGSKKG